MLTYEQMVERMARALWCARYPNHDPAEWGREDHPVRKLYFRSAEAALDASGLWPVYEAALAQRDALDSGLRFRATQNLRAALTAALKVAPAGVADRERVRKLVDDAVISSAPDAVDQATDAILSTLTTREEVEREVSFDELREKIQAASDYAECKRLRAENETLRARFEAAEARVAELEAKLAAMRDASKPAE